MKKLIIGLLVIAQYQVLSAQNVGIGTTTPNASALLDVTSTTKGVLLPRMTTAQRIAITGSVGLAVYDTDFKEFYYHNGITWKKILNNEFWNSSSTRSWIFNINDSIGLGTSTPDAKLEVIGNVKTSARIDAGGVVESGGLSSLGTLYVNSTSLLQGAVTGNSSATFNSAITSNTSMVVNDPTAILQLQNAAVNKGFVQLSGDNLRLGTNSGNTTGNVVVRMNGNDRITINPAGDITTVGKINRAGLGTADFLPICYGRIGGNGSVLPGGSGNFFVTRNGPGRYTIFVNNETTDKVVIITPRALAFITIAVYSPIADINGGTNIQVLISDVSGTTVDSEFNFVVFRNGN